MAAKGRVLILDDSVSVLQTLSARLVRDGYDVVTTTSVTTAATLVHDCDVVIVDYHMPGLSGADALVFLRRHSAAKRSMCRYYLYTTDSQQGAQYREQGFDGVYSLKGNADALIRQLDATMRVVTLNRDWRRAQ